MGTHQRMDRSPQTWHLERSAPVRADAEGLFVPASDLPDAVVGDIVVVTGDEGGEARTGTIAETRHRQRQRYIRLDFNES